VTKDGPVEVFIGSQVVAKRLLHLNLRAPLVNPPRGGLPGAGRAPPSFDLDSTRSVSRLFRRSNVTRSINPQDAQLQVATGRHAARASSRGNPAGSGRWEPQDPHLGACSAHISTRSSGSILPNAIPRRRR
jgi:hypothetical protein